MDRQTEERQQLEGALLRWKGEVVRLILHVQKMEQVQSVSCKTLCLCVLWNVVVFPFT